ncbi:MAG: TldD/PmbA family protein [Clostridia bacterium]|nr:TldD/PmbA family protein [Clostridia bacterium]
MNKTLFTEKLLDRAIKAGFAAAEVYTSSGDSFDTMVREGEIISYEVSNSFGLGFRGLINGKMGYASTQVLDEDAIDQLIQGAKANLSMIESDDEQFIFKGSDAYPQLETFDGAQGVSASAKIEAAMRLEKLATSISPTVKRLSDCGVFTSRGYTSIVNTMGLDIQRRYGHAGLYLSPIAEDGRNVNSIMKFQLENDFSTLDVESLAREAVSEADSGLRASPIPSGSYSVAFRNDAAAALLGVFAQAFSADAAQKGLSLLYGREGEMIASKAVSIVDDPLLPGARASRTFDGEGVATRRKALVEKGMLNTLMHNLKTAKKQSVETTANASRGYNTTVGISASNLFIEPGNNAAREIYLSQGNGVLITELQGLHSGANSVTGDFSLAAKGFIIENGEIGSAVNGITVAGNFFSLLGNIEMVGDDIWFGLPSASCVGSPTILAGKMSLGGR